MISILDYVNYKEFLNDRLDEIDGTGRGARSRMSKSIGCQTAYTAQVLSGNAHFSLEQADSICTFLGLDAFQSDYFFNLIQHARAGTPALKKRILSRIQEAQNSRKDLSKRLSLEDSSFAPFQMEYYSSWLFGAAHALISLETIKTENDLAKRLNIPLSRCAQVVDFLIKARVVKKVAETGLQVSKTSIHLPAKSLLINKHHMNWRLKAMQSLETHSEDDFHYSSVISLNKQSKELLHEKILKFIEGFKKEVAASKDETEVISFNLDYFKV